MAYSHPGLLRSSHANSTMPTLWTYTSTDNKATMRASGYFNDAAKDLRRGDIIFALLDTGGTPAYVLSAVTSADGAVPVTTGAVDVT